MDHLTRRRILAWSSGSAGTLTLFGADIAPAAAQHAKDVMPATPLEVGLRPARGAGAWQQ